MESAGYNADVELQQLIGDTIAFVRETFPDMDMLDQAVMIRALKQGKRVCVWRDRPTVYCLDPLMVSSKDTLDLHSLVGEYNNLVIIDLGRSRC